MIYWWKCRYLHEFKVSVRCVAFCLPGSPFRCCVVPPGRWSWSSSAITMKQASGLQNILEIRFYCSIPARTDISPWGCPQVSRSLWERSPATFRQRTNPCKNIISWYEFVWNAKLLKSRDSTFTLSAFFCFQEAPPWVVTRSWLSITRMEKSPFSTWKPLIWMNMLVSWCAYFHLEELLNHMIMDNQVSLKPVQDSPEITLRATTLSCGITSSSTLTLGEKTLTF